MGDIASSCADLTGPLKDSGSSHAEICSLMSRLYTYGIFTELGYNQILMCLETQFASEPTSAFASEEALDGLVPRTSDTQEILSTHLRPPTYSSAEANKYKQLHNQAFNLGSLPNTPSLLRRCLEYFIGISPFSRSTRSVSGNIFLGVINVARVTTPDHVPTQSATLLIDTGSDYNIVSLCLAKKLYPGLSLEAAPTLLANTGGGHMYQLGRMTIKWFCNAEGFRRRFVESEFYISAEELDVDILLGWRDIVHLGLVSVNPRLGFVGYTSKPPPVNKRTVAIEEAAAAARRRAEEIEMDNDALNQHRERQRAAYAHEQALLHAQSFASQYRALHGEAGLQQACQERYAAVYQQIYGS